MDSPTSLPHSRTRRSVPNLHKLNIAPLSSDYLLEPVSPGENDPSNGTSHSSYIQGRSAPTTPGILSLSRSTSRHRRHRTSRQGYTNEGNSYFSSTTPGSPTEDLDHSELASSTATTSFDIPKAKSSSALLPAPRSHPRRRQHPVRPIHAYGDSPNRTANKRRHHTRTPSTDWLYRAGLAIASETRETKGQSWLVRRESSTSVVHLADDQLPSGDIDLTRSHSYANYTASRRHSVDPTSSSSRAADDERGFGSPMTPRWGSRTGSQMHSRRGSKVGSRLEMLAALSTAGGAATPRDDYYDAEEEQSSPSGPGMVPDFVDSEEGDGEGGADLDGLEEEEVARLAQERGFGMGGWMDKLVSWSLFNVAEDGEESDAEAEAEAEAEEEEEGRRRARRLEEYVAERSRVKPELLEGKDGLLLDGSTAVKVHEPEDEGGWKDAAWLLSVASKVLF